MKTKLSIVYSILVIAAGAAIFFSIKSSSLQRKLSEVQKQQSEMVEKLNGFEQLASIDSMLLKGEYDTAIKSYAASVNTQKENKMGIPLRIALAEKLLYEQSSTSRFDKKSGSDIDSLSSETNFTAQEIRKFDSLNFTLEKTKVQLTRLRRQLKNKSFGEYLKFKSLKGNQIHYVGQVKNGKANGYGIALLDSGSRYEGQWQDNQRAGEGTFFWPDGEYYVGTYESDKRNGFGTYYWPNGEKYAGQWKEDKRSGEGKFFGADGGIIAGGEWNDDELVKIKDK